MRPNARNSSPSAQMGVWTSHGAVRLGCFNTVVDVGDLESLEVGPVGVEAVTGVDCSQVQDAA